MVKRVLIGHANSRDSGGVLIPHVTPKGLVNVVYAYKVSIGSSIALSSIQHRPR